MVVGIDSFDVGVDEVGAFGSQGVEGVEPVVGNFPLEVVFVKDQVDLGFN